jgi:hypothetical protein
MEAACPEALARVKQQCHSRSGFDIGITAKIE